MRKLIAIALALVVPTAASALPRLSYDPQPGAIEVQNRFLPGFLGGGKDGGNKDADATVRIDQLESQVRMLTGQVEQLTFSVRRLEQVIQQMQAGDQRGALAAPGAPPRSLGTLPGTATPPASAGTQTDTATASPAPPAGSGGLSGPIDLSVLNNGVGASGGFATGSNTAPSAPVATAPSGPPPQSPALASVRELQSTGRYAMAADQARALLAENPNGAEAGEARYLLGEALMAQGDYRAAANQFLENYTSDPNDPRAPASLLQLGKALNGLGENEAACSSLEELFGAYPEVSGDIRAAAERERQVANCA
ncbi:MAG: hypothetical protein AcusKO_05500 [Acuticoccus sp.]